jgi:hypothetical protein
MFRTAGILLFVLAGAGFFQQVRYAESVLPGTSFVSEPEAAVGQIDGVFAGIELYHGTLELRLHLKNGPGKDLEVYARRPRYGQLPQTMNYAVFARPERVETWTFLGFGSGMDSPESFEMGTLEAAERLMILFRDVNQFHRFGPMYRAHPEAYRMGIDAVVSLH